MALYKDTCRCQKCGEKFTWYYQSEGDGEVASYVPMGELKTAQVSGMMLVTEKIYDVMVDCPYCGTQNEFNCKIEQELEGLGPNPKQE